MDWRGKIGRSYIGWVSGILAMPWAVERIIGLAGTVDDVRVWIKAISMIPTPVATAALAVFALFVWARWGENIGSTAKAILSNKKMPVLASTVLFIVVGVILLAALLPWLVFGLAHIYAFSNAVLFWIRKDVGFWDTFGNMLDIILTTGGR